jgi:hypothetical protein
MSPEKNTSFLKLDYQDASLEEELRNSQTKLNTA